MSTSVTEAISVPIYQGKRKNEEYIIYIYVNCAWYGYT